MTGRDQLRYAVLAGVSGIALLAAPGASAQDISPASTTSSQSETISAESVQSSESMDASAASEEIVVRGVRGSLLRSIQAKRDADTIVDAISAEELGKFPNRNVAEALANIPGITVGRDGGP